MAECWKLSKFMELNNILLTINRSKKKSQGKLENTQTNKNENNTKKLARFSKRNAKREFITINAYNLKRSQTNNLALCLKELEKEQINPKLARKKYQRNITETKSWLLGKITKFQTFNQTDQEKEDSNY